MNCEKTRIVLYLNLYCFWKGNSLMLESCDLSIRVVIISLRASSCHCLACATLTFRNRSTATPQSCRPQSGVFSPSRSGSLRSACCAWLLAPSVCPAAAHVWLPSLVPQSSPNPLHRVPAATAFAAALCPCLVLQVPPGLLTYR